MHLSLRGGQLPVSAFFSKRTEKPTNLNLKRKHSSASGTGGQLSPKRRQKEIFIPSSSGDAEHATNKLGDDSHGSESRPHRSIGQMINEVDVDVGGTGRVEPRTTMLKEALDALGPVIIDLTDDESPRDTTPCSTPIPVVPQLETTPPTPKGQGRRRLENGSMVSLPSPRTAPNSRRKRRKCPIGETHEEIVVDHCNKLGTAGLKGLMKGDTTQGTRLIEHKGPCSPTRPIKARKLMPPPPLPLKALLPSSSASMPTLTPPVYRPYPSSSVRWVPSSQTQELSISRMEYLPDERYSDEQFPISEEQIVPSSQPEEWELELITESPSHYHVDLPPALEALPSHPPEVGEVRTRDASPCNYVESSQSQFEVEITAAWAERIAARRLEISRSIELTVEESETQDYDASDECSCSSEEVWKRSAFGQPRKPRSRPRSRNTGSSSASHQSGRTRSSSSISSAPYYDFCEIFEGRDDVGNHLPREEAAVTVSPTDGHRENGLVHEEAIPSTQLICTIDDASPDGSSTSEVTPSPVREFMAMFSDSQSQHQPEYDYEPAQVQESIVYSEDQ